MRKTHARSTYLLKAIDVNHLNLVESVMIAVVLVLSLTIGQLTAYWIGWA